MLTAHAIPKQYRLIPFFLVLGFLFTACQSINSSRTELGIPQSVVIFSFDDGPNNAETHTTARLLDILKQHQIRAMFALLGINAERNPELVRRIYNEGHYIINHGYADKWADKMGDDEFLSNLDRGEAAIVNALGHETLYPRLYRPHGGFYKAGQERMLNEKGYIMVHANIRIYDAGMTRVKQVKAGKELIRKIDKQGGGIVLLHDGKGSYLNMEKKLAKNPTGSFDRSWIPGIIEEIVPALIERGYVLNSQDIFLLYY